MNDVFPSWPAATEHAWLSAHERNSRVMEKQARATATGLHARLQAQDARHMYKTVGSFSNEWTVPLAHAWCLVNSGTGIVSFALEEY